MAARPQLTNYPALHSLLKNNPQANTDFNAIISALTSPISAQDRSNLEAAVEAERTRATEANKALEKSHAVVKKAVRFIRLLGEIMENQTNLSPYVQDVSEKRVYQINFNADQIRFALRWYWDVLGEKMEEVLATPQVDPADET